MFSQDGCEGSVIWYMCDDLFELWTWHNLDSHREGVSFQWENVWIRLALGCACEGGFLVELMEDGLPMQLLSGTISWAEPWTERTAVLSLSICVPTTVTLMMDVVWQVPPPSGCCDRLAVMDLKPWAKTNPFRLLGLTLYFWREKNSV